MEHVEDRMGLKLACGESRQWKNLKGSWCRLTGSVPGSSPKFPGLWACLCIWTVLLFACGKTCCLHLIRIIAGVNQLVHIQAKHKKHANVGDSHATRASNKNSSVYFYPVRWVPARDAGPSSSSSQFWSSVYDELKPVSHPSTAPRLERGITRPCRLSNTTTAFVEYSAPLAGEGFGLALTRGRH